MNRGIFFIALLLLAIGVIGLQTGAYSTFEGLFSRSPTTVHPATAGGGSDSHNNSSNSGSHGNDSNSTSNSNYFEVNTIFNYGNGRLTWFNDTKVAKNWNFYNLTVLLTNGAIYAKNFTISGSPEHQIITINGLAQNSTYYWSLWKFCPSHNAWDWADVGADEIAMVNNGIYGWYYQNYNTQFPPVAGAATFEVLDINAC